ncbi:MAG: hypothetical protein QOF41_3161 [Methylobacteriaceae bacterium]|nr:hypothetical protein [Methylobacteriaceae bacterium]
MLTSLPKQRKRANLRRSELVGDIMTAPVKPEDVRKATCDAMQRIYLVIVGFSITQALLGALTSSPGEFLGVEIFKEGNRVQVLLLLAFLFTIIRFAHGSILHLSALTGRNKWQWDMMALMTQAMLFFVVALSVKRTDQFIICFCIVIAWDTFWLVVFLVKRIHTKMETQWVISNGVFLAVLALIEAARYRYQIPDAVTAYIAAVLSITLALWDYLYNASYYFPSESTAQEARA